MPCTGYSGQPYRLDNSKSTVDIPQEASRGSIDKTGFTGTNTASWVQWILAECYCWKYFFLMRDGVCLSP